MKRGFTLVELSIVLVIIGLLIGGILAGQSMIKTAKILAQIRQIEQFDAALVNFQTKYKGLPGDSPLLNGIGNNNGVVDCGSCNWTGQEISYFWQDLSASGLLSSNGGAYTNVYTAPVFPYGGNNAPMSMLGRSGILVMNGNVNLDGDAYVIGDYSSYTAGANLVNPFPAVEYVAMLAIDNKIDDGNITGGNVELRQWNNSMSLVYNTCKSLTGGGCLAQIKIGTRTNP